MKMLLYAVVSATLAFAAVLAAADGPPGERRVALTIESTDLVSALDKWAQQSGFQIFVQDWKAAKNLTAPSINGTFTAQEALEQLLQGTPLTYVWLNDKAVSIRKKASQRSGSRRQQPPPIAKLETSEAPQSKHGTGSGRRDRESAATESGGRRDDRVDPLEEIFVTGTHVSNAEAIGVQAISLSRQDIEDRGIQSTEQLFDTLPQNFGAFDLSGTVASNGSALQVGNLENASGLDLRGLGPQSTLVLINSQRRAGAVQGRVVDVSAIPISLIDRVDIVSGGHSAVYGSDAVAGVVNLILRRSFDGAQAQVRYGDASGAGGEQFEASGIIGRELERYGFLLAYDYSNDAAFDAVDTALIVRPSATGTTLGSLDIVPERRMHSLFAAGHLQVTQAVEVFLDGHFITDENMAVTNYDLGGFVVDSKRKNDRNQYNVAVETRVALDGGWQFDLATNHSEADTDRHIFNAFNGFEAPLSFVDHARLSSVSAVVNGSGRTIAAIQPRLAAGIEARKEGLTVDFNTAPLADGDRTVRSAFVEVQLPIVGRPIGFGLERLELSVAGRYDDYSDFGGTFNPQFGLLWGLTQGVTVRASYSTAYRAPSLLDLSDVTFLTIQRSVDPQQGGATTPVLVVGGNNPHSQPEEADTWSVGIDWTPAFAPELTLNASYFDIRYEDRLDVPAPTGVDQDLVLIRGARYVGLIDRAPSADALDRFVAASNGNIANITDTQFDPATQSLAEAFPDLVVFDNRLSNVSTESVSGLDFGLRGRLEESWGDIKLGLNATYTLDHHRAVTPTSPAFRAMNDVGRPPDFRFSAIGGITRNSMGASLAVNYTDDYPDSFSASRARIGSWTTVDLNLSYRASSAPRSPFGGVRLALSVINFLDKDPPTFRNDSFGLRYDSANANPLGRFVSLQLGKDW